ncbi:Phytochrome [Heracleum sosnowskyi]|uniref:Phytochrome n=1 Tax=Heracleum sosnowskyi TaxID=360622 RepID=A0AAD8HQK5_9APIA|nr:Phytochrome [Heracleum sosnowskyi]
MASSSSRHAESSSTPKIGPRAIQAIVDAKLDADFDACGSSFDYTSSVRATQEVLAARQLNAQDLNSVYQHFGQKCKFIQPFGCLLALDDKTYKVIAYSENAREMLTICSRDVMSGGGGGDIALDFGAHLETFFTAPGVTVLHQAFSSNVSTLLNPILVCSKASGKRFYAMVHRVAHAIIIDFEPVIASEEPITVPGTGHSYMLAEKAITRLRSLPRGSMHKLCEAMVQEVFELTEYDRVMAYKFHEDDHGEVISEITKPGLEPFLGVHYPATDIPQVARYLFMDNVVRMLCDCRAELVKVLQDEKFPHNIRLFGSTVRGPHGCHQRYMDNMNSAASLVLAVVVKESDEQEFKSSGCPPPPRHKGEKLWGLIVCHNRTPKFVPCPIRNACKFLVEVFAVHISEETVLESLNFEKAILHTQTLLCNKLLQQGPLSIVSQSPNIKDLIKCDGAVLYYENKFYKMGVTPSDFNLYDIMTWINVLQPDCAGFITDSLCGSAFPVGLDLADVICGMAAVRITSKYILLWFRSHINAVLDWGGAKHDPGEIDDGRKMHPRSSFKAFKEVVKTRSVPWKDVEINAIHSLQLKLRNILDYPLLPDYLTVTQKNLQSLNIQGMREQEIATAVMVVIETAVLPILAVDAEGLVRGWNTNMYNLTGFHASAAIGKHLLTLVEESSVDTVKKMLELALQGNEVTNFQFGIKTYGYKISFGSVILQVDVCAVRDLHGHVVSLCLVARNVTTQGIIIDKFVRRENDYKAIMQNLRPLNPPIFSPNEFGFCDEWNQAMIELSGWRREEVMGKILLGEVFGTGTRAPFCRLKNEETLVNLGIVLSNARCCQEPESISFGFFARGGKYVECLLCTNRKLDAEDKVTGIFCFLQLATPESMQVFHFQQMPDLTAEKSKQKVAYVKKQVRNALAGILYTGNMSEGTDLSEVHRQSLQKCQIQLKKILDDTDIESMIDGYVNLQMSEFTLHEVFVACMSQVMKRINEKGINLVNDLANDIMSAKLYGDGLRLQQVLSDFMSTSVDFTPNGGHLGVSARLIEDTDSEQSVQPTVHFELRITHTGCVMPENLMGQMLGRIVAKSEDGISLFVSRKLLKIMNGDVQYLREVGKSAFIISLKFARAVKPEY